VLVDGGRLWGAASLANVRSVGASGETAAGVRPAHAAGDIPGHKMELVLQGCSVRSFRVDDAVELARLANDRDVWRNLKDRFPHPYGVEHANAFIAYSQLQTPESNFGIDVAGRIAGAIGFERRDDVWRRSVELGYWLGREYWNRGIGAQAVRAISAWAFAQWDIDRIWAGVFDWNPASARVLEKAGFTLEGRLRQSAFKDGQVLDELIYAIVRR
jgi:RimJ/RimL family protein N-acetyltransferase